MLVSFRNIIDLLFHYERIDTIPKENEEHIQVLTGRKTNDYV